MIRSTSLLFALALVATPAVAQEQQAGNEASQDTEATFQALIDACDDVDALMLRARIRLQLPRTTEDAAATAQEMLDRGFATCGEGDLEGAKTILSEALEIAEAGASENFGTDGSTETETAAAVETAAPEETATEETAESKPWWKFW